MIGMPIEMGLTQLLSQAPEGDGNYPQIVLRDRGTVVLSNPKVQIYVGLKGLLFALLEYMENSAMNGRI